LIAPGAKVPLGVSSTGVAPPLLIARFVPGRPAGTEPTADVVICGAGVAGIAAAHCPSVQHGIRDIVFVDDRPPLSLTSDKSTEAYRKGWPGPDGAMIALTNRSLDLTEALADETGNAFLLNRRGYLYATAGPVGGLDGRNVLVLWAYRAEPVAPVFPVPERIVAITAKP